MARKRYRLRWQSLGAVKTVTNRPKISLSPFLPRCSSSPLHSLLLAALVVGVPHLGCAARRTVAIVPRAAWDPLPPASFALPAQHPHRIVIHHDAVDYRPDQTGEEKMRLLLRASRQREGWPDVPYHYLIDRNGRIFTGRPEKYPGDTRTDYDPTDALHIAFLGNYSKLEPTPAQLDTLRRLVRVKARQYGIAATEIRLHHELVADTECPGDNVRRRLEDVVWLTGADFEPPHLSSAP